MSYSRLTQTTNQVRARWKFLQSFMKKDWQLTDYPIIFRHHNTDGFAGPERLKAVPWTATIVNWSIVGTGDSKRAAFESLETHFADFKTTGKPLPRSGTNVPLEFASDERVSQFPSLKDDFIRRILGLDWAFLSDESSLWDFHELESNDQLNRKILTIYGVDVSDVHNGNVADILERIEASNHGLARRFFLDADPQS